MYDEDGDDGRWTGLAASTYVGGDLQAAKTNRIGEAQHTQLDAHSRHIVGREASCVWICLEMQRTDAGLAESVNRRQLTHSSGIIHCYRLGSRQTECY